MDEKKWGDRVQLHDRLTLDRFGDDELDGSSSSIRIHGFKSKSL